MEKLISEYVSRMKKEDVLKFATLNGVTLNDDELEIVYKYAKEDWRTICFGNPREILDNLKKQINFESYKKIEALYVYFKNRYSNL